MKLRNDSGIALVSALLVLLLMSSLTVGFMAMATTDTRVRSISGSRTQAFYFAHAGLEKMTADLGALFSTTPVPTAAQMAAIMADPPDLPGVTWMEGDGDSGYRVDYPKDAQGNPVPVLKTVMSGPYQGFLGNVTNFSMDVTAHLQDGSEANLTKSFETVAIPLFQFGMYSELDMSFFGPPSFDFGGRVHTNGNLFLAAASGPVRFADPVMAVGEVIRTNLANGVPVSPSFNGNVNVRTTPNKYRALAENEGSLVGTLGTAQNEPTWTNLSTGVYNYNIRNGRTGAKQLTLPIIDDGGQLIDMIRRPPVNENVSNPALLERRMFKMASLRILLSDTAAEITSLPTVTATPPIQLTDIGAVGGYIVSPTNPPFALSPGPPTFGARTPAGTPLLGGFLKVERQTQAGVWDDVTLEMLNLGIAGRQWINPAGGTLCAEPNPNAVIRIQRIRDDDTTCLNGSVVSTDYWPNVLYDAREGRLRDGAGVTTPPNWGGVMHYIELDAANLKRWFEGAIGTSGSAALNVNGYVVYFSDRRTNRNAANLETGEYGFEDVVNTNNGGTPNGVLDTGEDVNGNGAVDVYGQTPRLVAGMSAPYSNAIRPWTAVDDNGNNVNDLVDRQIARSNPAVFFRRALKLVNGATGNLPMPGLTVASENPVYVESYWNASKSGGFDNNNSATAIIADAVTALSTEWNDRNSFLNAHNLANRKAKLTHYRFAALSGKGLAFPNPSGTAQTFGTDGGTHNQVRFLEDWPGNTMRYRGSLATLWTSRQATGTFKCCQTVFNEPSHGLYFDTNFLVFSLLPPRTPMFMDMNTTGFAQIIRPR